MDFAKKTSRLKRGRKVKIKPIWIFLPIIFVTLAGASFFIYRSATQENGLIAANIKTVKSWISDRKKSLQTEVKKVKQLAVNKDEEQPIHFEFYTDLPNAPSVVPTSEIAPEQIINKKTVKKVAISNTIFMSPEELEKELSEKIKQTKKSKQRD